MSKDDELRGAVGNLIKWLEEYHELGFSLLKFEHPADREQFYKLAEKLFKQYGTKERLDELHGVGNAAVDAESARIMDYVDFRLAILKDKETKS